MAIRDFSKKALWLIVISYQNAKWVTWARLPVSLLLQEQKSMVRKCCTG